MTNPDAVRNSDVPGRILHPSEPWPVGVRVMVRIMIDDPHHKFTDLLGYVRADGPLSVTVETRSGLRTVPRRLIETAKIIPPPPPARKRSMN